jgi:biopolymer transport protein ExbB
MGMRRCTGADIRPAIPITTGAHAEAKQQPMWDWLSEVFQTGGPFFIVNTFFLAVVLAIIIERAIYFLGRGHINAKAFLEQIKRLLAANNIERAKKLCDATTAPIARVAKAGLNRIHRGEAAVAQAMEETMVDITPEVKTRISALWSMANIVTLTGLLGTITGLINTFSAVAEANPADRQKNLSLGISEAMYNTAFGLSIALVCMVAHLLLSTAMKRVVSDLESFSLRLENMLGDGGTAAAAARAAAQQQPERNEPQ